MPRADKELRLAYVCQGGGRLGWGHIGRGQAVVEAGGRAATLVVGRGHEEALAWARSKELSIDIARWVDKSAPFDGLADLYDVVVVDDYDVDGAWIANLSLSRPVIVLDDWQRPAVTATALLNPNLDASENDYPSLRVERRFFGPRFALLRREVLEVGRRLRCAGTVRHVLLTLGGSDPNGYTAEVAEVIRTSEWFSAGSELTIVLGRSYSGPRPWEGWRSRNDVTVRVLQDPPDYLKRCWDADLVVSASGTSTYELAYLGTPFIPVAIVGNQDRVVKAWARRGVGVVVMVSNARWQVMLRQELESVSASGSRLRQMAAVGQREVDGYGVPRLLEACRRLVGLRR